MLYGVNRQFIAILMGNLGNLGKMMTNFGGKMAIMQALTVSTNGSPSGNQTAMERKIPT
jgi:hypothetical protein